MNILRDGLFRTGIISAAVILLAGPCFGGTWTNYSESSFVSGLDAQGNNLWAATAGGVLLWDIAAQTYTKYTTIDGLADMNLKDVFIDNAGNIWFGCTEGVQCYDGSTWVTYNTGNSPLPGNTVYSVIQDIDGAMWFGTSFGCAKLTGSTWEVFTDLGGGATNVAVRGMGVDSQNHIWTANNPSNYGDPGAVSMYNGTSWTHFDPDPGSIGQYFLSLTVDGSDNVWAESWTDYVFVYDGSTWTHYDDGNSSLLGNNIEAFEVEDNSILWISNHPASPTSSNSGVARYDGSAWSILTPAGSGLPDPYVYAISSADGVTWFGTANNGTAGYDGSNWDYLEAVNEPHTNYFTTVKYGDVGTSDACFYFGTDHSGIAILNGGIWSSYRSDNCGLGDNYINDLHIANNILWAACQYTGVWKYNGSSWVNYNTGNCDLLGDIILSVDADTQGNIWFGTSGWAGPGGQDGALSRFNGSTWTNYYLENSGIIDNDNLQVFVGPEDTVWVGTEEGISKFDGSSNWTSYHTGNSGLIENHVVSISFDETGGKWFAIQGGISHFSGGTWTSYTTANGLPGNNVRDICISGSGVVWAATDSGIAFYDESTGWTAFTQTDGLADNNVTCTGMGDGELAWFGTYRSGISSFDNTGTGISFSKNGTVLTGQILASPNPFISTVEIQYSLSVQEHVHISVFDMSGRIVKTLANETQQADQHSVYWDGTGQNGTPLSGGMYFYQINSNSITASGKLILLR